MNDPRAVDLWTLPEHRVEELVLGMGGLDLLTPDERARHHRLLRAGSRARFLGGRLLCRLALSARAGLPPDTWRFTHTRHGRPELTADHDGLRFNLSHTDGLIACVVAQGRGCGVDVERVPFDDEKTRLLSAFLGDVSGASVSERWVLAEAYLKGLGVGLAEGLGGLVFRRHADGRFTVADHHRPTAAARWRLALLRPSPHHLVAVATEGGGPLRTRTPSI
ncbi:4'-phosphopantetheinyl transferase family protein [Streptomyces sp. NPDC096132]|uniref:4'-phosphopantetheinyl transferase family protein n=1 Tax=Streptomyces sp. NPDC096132 TaxID=3366075 RepID=UPI0037F9D85C